MDSSVPQLSLLGVDFTTAPVAVREALSYTPDAAGSLLRAAVGIAGLREAVVVSTCNRTEFYLAADANTDVVGAWLGLVRRDRPGAPIAHDGCTLFRTYDDNAVRHLCRVSCGLESSILGDVHIGGQLKQALAIAGDAGGLGPFLTQAFQHASRALKLARSSTDIGRGHASLGSAVVALVEASRVHRPRVLIVGYGVAARDVGRQLAKRRAGELTVVGRRRELSDDLARQLGGRSASWEALERELVHADVVVAATAAPRAVVRREQLVQCVALRGGRPLLAIDVGVPRNIEPCDGVECLTIDDIAAKRDEALWRRRQSVPAVEQIIEDEIARWRQWIWARPGEELIKRVFVEEQRARAELVNTLLASGFTGCPDDVERLVARSWGRMLSGHARSLRHWLRTTPTSGGGAAQPASACR